MTTHRRTIDRSRDGQIESATWNPTTGCDTVSPGCDHCYALAFAKRLKAMGSPGYQNEGDPRTSGPGFRLAVHPDRLRIPLRWRRPHLVFVDSMSDLFHPAVSTGFIADVLDVMREARQHTFFALTKRPARMASVLTRLQPTPLDNVWWGTTIETNDYVRRADRLRDTPAAVRFLSLQPLLGPLPDLDLRAIDWVYVGGESGPRHRPMDASWVRPIRDRCVRAGIPFLFKQWGGRTRNAHGRLLDGRTWDCLPGDRPEHA
ncbi:MAG TPA: phage Gp37/Gp68 family protein [Amycolatopsis sp.]|nr:phage Gp37/Gp68 family protein [Amycolatopsis sp.]